MKVKGDGPADNISDLPKVVTRKPDFLTEEERIKLHDCPLPFINVPEKEGTGIKILLSYSYKLCWMVVIGLMGLLFGAMA